MGNEKTINSLKAGMVFWRVLKVAFYLLGFLLLFHLVYKDSSKLEGHFFESAVKIPLYYVAGAWAVVALVQLICAFVCKNTLAKIIIVAIIGFAVIAGPLVYMDFFIKPEFDQLEQEYESEGLDFKSYGLQVIEYPDLVEDLNEEVNEFLDLYNIEYESNVYGSVNTDTSEYLEVVEGTDVIDTSFFTTDYVFGLAKGDAAYSKNGMYADGYVFGYAQARYILETYYNTQQKYIKEGGNADDALNAAIAALTTNLYSDWNEYKQSDEYLDFYGDNVDEVTNAKRYYVTPERLDDILSVLGANLGSGDSGNAISSIINIINMASPDTIPQEVIDFINGSLNGTLSLSSIVVFADALGLAISEDMIFNLLEGFSNYQSPQTKPVFYFIEDPELRDYAYAKYFAEVHGGKIGSVLIGEKIGCVTMDESGSEAEDLSERMTMFKQTEKDEAYMVKYFPWLSMRDSFLYFAGLIPFTVACAYLFASLEKKKLDQLIKGGAK